MPGELVYIPSIAVLLWKSTGPKAPLRLTLAVPRPGTYLVGLQHYQSPAYGALSIAVLGACLGFLFYNLNPASIFMGDSGSLFLGFVLAAIGIKLRFPDNVTFVTWMIPVLVMGLPIFDTTLVIISRLRRGLNPLTTPGKDHISHRLVAAGMTQREAVLTLYVVSFILGMLATFVTRASVIEGYIVGGLVALAGIYGLWRVERPPFFKR